MADLVERFATAIDTDDYATAASCMEEDAVYDEAGEKKLVGRDAILGYFRSSSEWGKANLESLTYSHEIDEGNPLQIRLIDQLKYGGDEIAVDHMMHVSLSKHGLIAALRLEYPDGERNRVRAFFEHHGLALRSE